MPVSQPGCGPCPTFARLVSPSEPLAFIAEHWDERAVLLPGAGDIASRALLERFDLSAFARAAACAPSGGLAASRTDETGALSGIAISPGQMEFCYRAGMTVNLQDA